MIQFLLVSLPVRWVYHPYHPRDRGRPAHQDGPLARHLRCGENLQMFPRCLCQKIHPECRGWTEVRDLCLSLAAKGTQVSRPRMVEQEALEVLVKVTFWYDL